MSRKGSVIRPLTKPRIEDSEENNLLELYYNNPISFTELLKNETIKKSNLFQGTVFEEIDIFDFMDTITSNDKPSDQEDIYQELQSLFRHYQKEDQLFSPLLILYVLLDKRIQILDNVQNSQLERNESVNVLKLRYESLPLENQALPNEENILLLKNLQKAMLKTDVKKGLFSKLKISRSETIFRLLAKHTLPMSLYGEDVEKIRDYLYEFALDTKESRKRRSRSLVSLMILAMSKGSFLDVILMLHATLSFSPEINEPLSQDDSEEGGIFMRQEVIDALEKFSKDIRTLCPKVDLKESKYNPVQILKMSQFSCPNSLKKPTPVRQLFVFIVAHIDLLAQSYIQSKGLLFRAQKEMLNIHFLVESSPKTFDLLKGLIDKLVGAQEETIDSARIYCISALLRMLRLNVESLQLWKKYEEPVNSVAVRTVHGKVDWIDDKNNYITQLKSYLMQLLQEKENKVIEKKESMKIFVEKKDQENITPRTEEVKLDDNITLEKQTEEEIIKILEKDKPKMKKKEQQGGDDEKSDIVDHDSIHEYESDDFIIVSQLSNLEAESNTISLEVASILCSGFTLFYPIFQEQEDFLIEHLKNIQYPLKRAILNKVLKKMIEDNTLFVSFWINGVGFGDNSLKFIDILVDFCKNYTLGVLNNDFKKGSPTVHEIILQIQQLMLRWQNQVLKKVSPQHVTKVKAFTSTSPKTKSVDTALFFNYSSMIFDSFTEIMDEVNSICSELKTFEENKEKIDETLKDSLIGNLFFPLIHGYSKLFWKKGNSTEDFVNLSEYVSKYIYSLMKSISTYNEIFKNKEVDINWYIIETNHPYKPVKQDVDVDFDKDCIGIVTKIDPKSRTALRSDGTYDHLRIHTNECEIPTQSLAFGGKGSSIPSNPLLTSGSSIKYTFDAQSSEWGIRMSSFPLKEINWMVELEKTLVWMTTRIASTYITAVPVKDEEKDENSWINNALFKVGFDEKNEHNSFLQDFIQGKGDSISLIQFMEEHLINERTVFQDNQIIISSERCLIAALIKHTKSLNSVIEMTKQIMENPKEVKVPSTVLSLWKFSRQIRMWMAGKKQREKLDFDVIYALVLANSQFLLLLSPSNEETFLIQSQVYKFITNKWDIVGLKSLLDLRKNRAQSRLTGCKIFLDLVETIENHSMRSIVVHAFQDVLQYSSLNYHILNNVIPCGFLLKKELLETTRKLYFNFLKDLSSENKSALVDGLLREILGTLFIKFSIIDVDWIIEYDLIKKLTSFMFDYPKVEVSNFMINPNSVEEKKQISLKSWKIFKVLAIRIALIVEKWDDEQTTVEVENREKVLSSLTNLVEEIFSILFVQLESFVKGTSIQVHTLTEILAIISTLSSTECGLKNSSSKRFLKILLPMLRVNNHKCQEISLQLAGKLIQNSDYSNDLNKLLISLFEFLGSHVIFSVIGKDYFKLQSQNIRVTKNIFHIIRKLLLHKEWKIQIQNLISEQLIKITNILKNGILKDIEEPLRFLLAVTTVICGLNYIPNPGESVKIFLNNRWEEAKLINLNEHTLSVKIKKNEIYDVDSEFVNVFTNEFIENFEFKSIDDLITFVMICGDFIENNQIDSVEIKLLLNYLWMRSIEIMSLWPQEKRNIDQLIFQFERLIEFSKYDTGRLYGKIPKFDSCTYTWTGSQFFRQYYYSCKTCGMGKKQAVCAFCAKTCHAGHDLQAADSGDFYCDCGVGEGKYPCKSLKKSNPEKIPSIEKLEALGMRYQSLMPFYQMSTVIKGEKPKKFNLANGYYETNGRIAYKNMNMTYSMLAADPVESSFYFEVKVLKINPRDTIAIGFTNIVISGKGWTDVLGSSSSFHLNSGHLYTGQVIHKVCFGPTCNQNDIYGFGYSKENSIFFITKNGENLGTGFTSVKERPYHPMLILKGDSVVSYNFGEQNFSFPIDSVFRTQAKKNISPLKELKNLGYSEEACLKAMKKHPNDLNAAAAVLHNSKDRSLRDELAEKLEPMGFDIEICKRALAIAGDDVDTALNILLEGTIDLTLVKTEEKTSLQFDSGISLLGSNISQNEFDSLIMKSMLQYIDTPLNLNCVYTVDFSKLAVGDFVVVNPDVIENEQSLLSVFKGRIGVISKKDINGVNVNIFDQETKTVKTILLYPKHLLAAPFTMNRASILEENLSNYKALSSLYVRKILTSCLINTNLLPTSLSPSKMYRALKVLFIDQYNHQTLSFMNDDVKLPENIKDMMKSFDSVNVKTMDGEIPVFDYVAEEALNEMKTFKDNLSHFRKFEYTSDMNHKMIYVKFFNATNLYINFVKCDLGVGDSFNLWNDKYEKFEIKKFKGPVSLPRFFTVAGNSFYFQFKCNDLKEGSGFKFFISPTGYQFNEPTAIMHPNLGLATTICKNASLKAWSGKKIAHEAFKTALEYVLVPYAPYKGTVIDALCNMSLGVYKTKPSLDLLKHFRLELEDLYDEYLKHYDVNPRKFPIFHRLVDFFSYIRRLLTSDLCSAVFPNNAYKKTHFYSIAAENNQQFKLCTSCAIIVGGDSKYYDQEKKKCIACLARQYNWGDMTFSNLVPIETVKMNPSEWFEHVNWIDQVAIVRHLCESFLLDDTLPDWVYYEAALETKKKLVYKSSPHPYSVVDDEATINIPGAKTLYVSFDKHSKTHKSEKIIFKGKNSEDIGSFSGEELKDKTIIVHGNTLSYKFVATGGDHECLCNHCGVRVNGVRFHCTECDDYDLCSKCMRKDHIHDETHIFLKIRRPVDCVPAGLPHLYTHRWSETSQFRGTTHSGVKCDNCNAFPIKGIRYMCENCQDFNLCSTCAQEEYKYHDRMHVFLRVVRPLPPKKQLPPNALPYGLVYEKDLDTHWGYLFSVSSSENNTSYSDKIISEIKDSMKGWSDDLDTQLVQYVEKCCNGWQSLEWGGLLPTNSQLVLFPKLSTPNIKALRYRFIILKLLNRKISRILHLTDVSNLDSLNSLGHLISKMREKLFSSVKMDVWSHIVSKSVVDIAKPISLKLNRQKAAEKVEDKLLFARNSVFYQTFEQLQAMDVRILSRKKAAWKVTFLGESADDYGGPFRESLTQMCQELQTDQLDLLIPVPNSKVDGGKNGDKFIPNPSANTDQHLKLFRFLGLILGVGLLDALILPIDFPSIVWKCFVNQPLDEFDLEAIDTDLYNSLKNLKTIESQGVTEDNFGDYIFNTFTAQASDGTEIELVKNGKTKAVTFKNRFNYVDKVMKFRLYECEAQIKAICEGLYSIIPSRFFNIFTWDELELLCCGRPEIDPKVLKKHTIYEGYNQNSKEIKDFWTIFNEFSNEERSIYLKFVWGRARLPISEDGYSHPMKIQKLDRSNPDKYLPLSHTCFFSIELPSYTSKQIMKEKLLYAINNCKAIDTDATTVANESRNMNQ